VIHLGTADERLGVSDLTRLPGPVSERWDWQLAARCRGMPSDVFFHSDNERGAARAYRVARATAVCRGCPVIEACRAHALRVREPYGIWGGLSEEDREALLAGSPISQAG
jgi:WhiB family transcriptional regulator, redox-sensing transcriptional regulator